MSSFPVSSQLSISWAGMVLLCVFGAVPHGVGTGDVNVWLHCLQIYSSHVDIAITWQQQYETNAFVAHLSSHSWEIQNLLTFLAVFWGRVGRCALLDVKVLFLLLEEKCYCQLNFWLWLKVFLTVFYLWALALGHAVALPLLALTLVVLFGLSEIEPKPLLYSLCWSWGCEVAQELFQGSFLWGPQVGGHLHLLTWGQPEVSCPSQQTLHLPFTGRWRLWRTLTAVGGNHWYFLY